MITNEYQTQIAAKKQYAYGALLSKQRRGLITLDQMNEECNKIEVAWRAAHDAHHKLAQADGVFQIALRLGENRGR